MNRKYDYLCLPNQLDNQKKCYCKYCNGILYHQQYRELKGIFKDYQKQISFNLYLKKSPSNFNINKTSKILFISVWRQLYLVQLVKTNGQFKILQKLTVHGNHITTFQNQMGYLSADSPFNLNFVYFYKQRSSFTIQKLSSPQNKFCSSYLLNDEEDLFICGYYEYLQFYKKQDEWVLKQQMIFKEQTIVGLNLNTQESKLILELRKLTSNLTLLILETQNNEWVIVKEIDWMNNQRIQFLSHDVIVRNFISESLELLQWDQQIEDFKQIHQTQLYGIGFIRIKFIKQQNLLFILTNNSINVYKYDSNGEFLLLQIQTLKTYYKNITQVSQDGDFVLYADLSYGNKIVKLIKQRKFT